MCPCPSVVRAVLLFARCALSCSVRFGRARVHVLQRARDRGLDRHRRPSRVCGCATHISTRTGRPPVSNRWSGGPSCRRMHIEHNPIQYDTTQSSAVRYSTAELHTHLHVHVPVHVNMLRCNQTWLRVFHTRAAIPILNATYDNYDAACVRTRDVWHVGQYPTSDGYPRGRPAALPHGGASTKARAKFRARAPSHLIYTGGSPRLEAHPDGVQLPCISAAGKCLVNMSATSRFPATSS